MNNMLKGRVTREFGVRVTSILLACMATLADLPANANEHDTHASTWNLPNDLLKTSNQISFNQGARDVWYFMQSTSFVHNPIRYSLLPDYEALCQITPTGSSGPETVPGLPCWKNFSQPADHLPQADLNVTNTAQVRHGVTFPPHAFAVHPSPIGFAIVAWRSPVRGTVNVNGFFTDLNPCSNGVIWTIDRGATTLASGEINDNSESFNLSQVHVARGQVLYFIVDPNGDYSCDTTQLELNISARESHDEWDDDKGSNGGE